MHPRRSRYLRHRFPSDIISHAVWLYHRYCLSFRDVEDLLAERGIIVSYETIRQWCAKFGLVPQGVKEKAQIGLQLLKSTVLEFARANPHGITNADAASLLGLRSDDGGGSKDYLSYSLIGMLMRDGLLRRDGGARRHIATTD